MLTWETINGQEIAYLNGYSYAIGPGDAPNEWAVEITDPDGGMQTEVCNTIEEAKQFCEKTAAELQAEE